MSAGTRTRAGLVEPGWWVFVAVALGRIQVKGQPQLVDAWRLLDPSA